MKTPSLFPRTNDSHPVSAEEQAALARKARYSVAGLAKVMGCSSRQLERDCMCCLHTTPRCWLEAMRWAEARRLLQTDLPLKDISDRLGYRRSEHFSRAFQRVHGVSPSAFRAREGRMSQNGRFLSRNGRPADFHFLQDGFLIAVSEKPVSQKPQVLP